MLNNIFISSTNERKILIFGLDAQITKVQEQIALFNKEINGIQERDIKILVVKKGDLLHEKYGITAESFMVILIGKDGSEKFRTDGLLAPEKLFALVDAMPMRQSEMNKKKNR